MEIKDGRNKAGRKTRKENRDEDSSGLTLLIRK
jgi:hypothetical protein